MSIKTINRIKGIIIIENCSVKGFQEKLNKFSNLLQKPLSNNMSTNFSSSPLHTCAKNKLPIM